jgi:hypothetical protein
MSFRERNTVGFVSFNENRNSNIDLDKVDESEDNFNPFEVQITEEKADHFF